MHTRLLGFGFTLAFIIAFSETILFKMVLYWKLSIEKMFNLILCLNIFM